MDNVASGAIVCPYAFMYEHSLGSVCSASSHMCMSTDVEPYLPRKSLAVSDHRLIRF